MMIVQFLVVIVLSLFVWSEAWIKKGAAGNTNGYLQRRYISDDDSNDFHRISIAVKSKNMDVLEQLLMNVSNPNHVDYGKHWTKKRIGNLIRNDAAIKAIKNHLLNEDATIISETPNGETIEAQATIRTWSRIFNTNFYEFESKTDTKKKLIRALEYSIPQYLNPHIDSVFGLVEFPVVFGGQPIIEPIPDTRRSLRSDEISVQGSKFVTPAVFSNTYGISSNTGNGLTTQSAFSCIGQTMSTTDLTAFQQYFGIPVQGLSKSYGGHVKANACSSVGLDNCAEANLDFQYLMGISRSVPTISLYEASCDYATFFQSLTDPPKVISISYAGIESYMGSATLRRFNNVAIQLGVMGVTIVVASGDDGAAGFNVRDGTESCAYNPFFPASSPYVLAVGATQGPEFGATEVACQSDTGGVITSGGGFSVYNSVPDWQADAVSSYFSKVSRPVAGYNTNGRGYPDISALGHAYLTFLAGQGYSLSGTSASSPSVAAMLSLINSARKAIGKSTLGFVNPLLYTYSSNFVRDITQGNNYCTANPSKCCSQGFVATSGWDPVTGLGVLDYPSFYNFAVGFNSFTPSASPASVPTIPPTNAPTLADGETYAPTPAPTATPTVTPTRTPSKSPTPSPTKVPSRRPTAKPTRVPTKSPTPKPTRTSSKPTKRPTFQPFL